MKREKVRQVYKRKKEEINSMLTGERQKNQVGMIIVTLKNDEKR